MQHARVSRGASVSTDLPPKMRWMKKAKCKRKGNQIFSLAGKGKPKEVQQVIDEYCKPCVVRGECLNYGINIELELKYTASVIWGGALPSERRNLRRTIRERPGCKTFYILRFLRLKERPTAQDHSQMIPSPIE